MDRILSEARRLHKLGFAVHWLLPNSKRPVESGWTTGPRKGWKQLFESYKPGYNVGVRLGEPSKILGKYLAVIDVDVKSTDKRHQNEVLSEIKKVTGGVVLPQVRSGRGNGSRHYYILTEKPVTPFKAAQSSETVKVAMPSARPSKKELGTLTAQEIANGVRLRAAWEVALMGEGQQVVLPPSVHPDSGKEYAWKTDYEAAAAHSLETLPTPISKPIVEDKNGAGEKFEPYSPLVAPPALRFEVEPVELGWLPISPKIKAMIETGEGVEDRSAMLLPIASALCKAGLTVNETLTVLTDEAHYISSTAYSHAGDTKSRARAAYWLYRFTVAKVYKENSAENIFSEEFTGINVLSDEELENSQSSFDDAIPWTDLLDRTDKGAARPTLRNVLLILKNTVASDVVKRDTFAFREFYSQDTPWKGKAEAALSDIDPIKIKAWLGDKYGMEPATPTISNALSHIAEANSFDPVLDWLEGLPAWDEVERLDTWLINHFNAEGDPNYLAQVFRKWLCGMVIRILKPGAKFDWMPIFEGVQGVGKSSFGRMLVGEKYFLDWLPDMADKDSALALQGVWAVELGELASLRKSDIEAVKAFITRTVDKVRPPYGERWLEIPRRCVFFGTTNFETYLRDESGNRRFKPCKVGQLDFQTLVAEREQLFAEALWLVRAGFESEATLDVSGDEAKAYEKSIQNEKMVQDESALMAEVLFSWLDDQKGKSEDAIFPLEKFKISDLFADVKTAAEQGRVYGGPLHRWRLDSRNVQFASKALRKVGGLRHRSKNGATWEIPLEKDEV